MADSNEKPDRGDDFPPKQPEVKETPVLDEEDKKVIAEVKGDDKAEEKKDEPERDEKGKFVPRERMNEAVNKERAKAEALAARAAELEEKLSAHATAEDITKATRALKDLVKQRNSLLADGKLDEASEVDGRIFDLQEAIAERKAENKFNETRSQAIETVKYDTVVERLEAEHPELNPDSDKYDDELALEIRSLMRGYQQELKLSASQALTRAANRVFSAQKKDEKKDDKAEDAGLRRKAEAAERNIEAAKKQPASTKDVGIDHDKKGGGLDAKTVLSMTQKEFAELGEDVLSRLRGDTLG